MSLPKVDSATPVRRTLQTTEPKISVCAPEPKTNVRTPASDDAVDGSRTRANGAERAEQALRGASPAAEGRQRPARGLSMEGDVCKPEPVFQQEVNNRSGGSNRGMARGR
jgi:hypothetical protein